jgi:hypothetical protein
VNETPVDVAAIKADHESHWQSGYVCLGGREYAEADHCLPYRLAEALDRAQAAAEGVDMLVAQAERRGAVKALRWFEGKTDGLNHALLGTTWIETRDRANAIESGAAL